MAIGADAPDSFEPRSETAERAVLGMLRRAQKTKARLHCGFDRRIEPRTAVVDWVGHDSVHLTDANFAPPLGDLLRISFNLEGHPYYFEASVLEVSASQISLRTPRTISRDERRSRDRLVVQEQQTITIDGVGSGVRHCRLVDTSPEGISVHIPDHPSLKVGAKGFLVQREGSSEYGTIRYRSPVTNPKGWVRLGIELLPTKAKPVSKQKIEDVYGESHSHRERIWRRISLSTSALGAALDSRIADLRSRSRESVDLVEFSDRDGRPIRGIIDSWGRPNGATCVVIPPAWGRTKETLLPLAHTIVSAFSAAQQPIRVLRFDGIGKRGESYREPAARAAGNECIRMRFSQGVEDILSAVDYVHSDPSAVPGATIVVSFSAASIEARRAVAIDKRIGGWVCVVGSADLQSMMKRISGGVDYALGIERGVRFGNQEILGVTVDMDLAGRDALDHRLVYMADARRDMAQIRAPVTWIYGRSDAWMDVGRVQDILSQGDTSRRRLIEAPMGHMMRSSRQALSVFHFIATEIYRFSGHTPPLPVRPALSALARKQRAERSRRSGNTHDARAFWETYLLGGEAGGGYEVLTKVSPFIEFMKAQAAALCLDRTSVVADLGCGTGEFLRFAASAEPKRVIEVDLIREVLQRLHRDIAEGPPADYVQADLSNAIPLANQSVDRVIASLVLSYLPCPRSLLAEIDRILRPGGRLVVSTLVSDADMSKLFVDGVDEIRKSLGISGLDIPADEILRNFTNHASRLLDLEEQGTFRFWEPEEFRSLIIACGLRVESTRLAFGCPPQAVIVTATKHQ